ncbi:ATP-binding cassette domain-containing protein [Chloroflexota bacterium]
MRTSGVYVNITSDNESNTLECAGATIRAEGISRSFGKIKALDDLSLTVDPGTVFALLGPNGSGKTTTVRILTTLLHPDSGFAYVGDYDVVKQPQSVRSIIGLAGQYPAVDEDLTGKENLEMIGRLYHLGKKIAKIRSIELLEVFDLADAANRRVKTYSGGMRRRLDLAATLVAKPPILFLDEPTTGLDPRSRLGLWDVISEQSKNCNTVFLTTQNLEEADRLADKIAIMDNGKIIQEGTSQELKEYCGGSSQVKIKLVDRSRTVKAVEILRDLSEEPIYNVPETGEISLPATSGTSILADVVRRMDASGMVLAEVGIKQPTLDDVFLSITGHVADYADKVDESSSDVISEKR